MSYKTWALAHPELTYAYSLEKQRLNSALISIDYYQKRLNDPEFAWMLDHSARHLAEYQSTADYQRKILRDFNPENACTFKKSGRPRMIESALVERFYPLLSKSGFEYIINNLTSMSEDLDDNHWLAMNSLDLLRNLVNESDGTDLHISFHFGLKDPSWSVDIGDWVCTLDDRTAAFTRTGMSMIQAIGRSVWAYLDYNWDNLIAVVEKNNATQTA